jgi:hypothetical protein
VLNEGAPTGSRCPKLAEMRVPLANLRISDNEGDGEGVSIDLDGHGHLFALATRKVIDELALAPGGRACIAPGDGVFALVKSMNAQSRWWTPHPGSFTL